MPWYKLDGVGPTVHAEAYVHPDAVLIGDVHIGAQSSIWPGAVLRADYGPITVGARTSIQDGSVLHTTAEWPTVVAEDCVVGHMVHLEGCSIEPRCLVASGAVVLNRATVMAGSVVAAGAMVSEGLEVPPGHMARGVPARTYPLTRDHSGYIEHAIASYVRNGQRYRNELEHIHGT